MDHIAWIKHHTVERLKTRQMAEQEWWEAVADLVKYLGRGYLGPGECPTVLNCMRSECAGGKLQLHVREKDIIDLTTSKGRSHRSQVGTKQRRKFNDEHVAAADKQLAEGHERLSPTEFSAFSKAVVSIDNPSSKQSVDDAEEDDIVGGKRARIGKGVEAGPGQHTCPWT